MKHKDNNRFSIKEDGTIVRDSTSSKVNQMKKKISSEGDFNNQSKDKKGNSSKGCFAFLAIIALLIIGIVIFKGGNDDSSYSDPASEVSDSIEANDDSSDIAVDKEFVTTRYSLNDKPVCKIMVDYPTEGKPELVNAIRQWINKHLASMSEATQYGGELIDGSQLVDYYYSMSWIDKSCEECSLEIDIRKEYETDKYVTFLYSTYEYSGGAHGLGTEGGATFRKSDGLIIDWAMFKNDSTMQRLIKEGLDEYFDDEDYDKGYTSLPSTNPIFLANGVKFIYNVYEIAVYAKGMPNFTIPYSKIKYQMNSSLYELINEN